MSPQEASEYTKKLLALGYLSGSEARPLAPSGGDAPGMTEGAWNNLGLFERESRKDFAAARQAFEKSLALRPDYHSPMFNMAVLYRQREGLPEGRGLALPRARGGSLRSGGDHRELGRRLRGGSRVRGRCGGCWSGRSRPIRPASASPASSACFASGRGTARAPTPRCRRSRRRARDPETLNAIGLFRTCLGRKEEAIGFFERSLALNPDQPGVIRSLKMLRGDQAPPGS